jgi:two-component system, cell cycle response regulator DivK
MKIILLVEDDDMSRDMLSRRLVKLGYVVIEARNGVEAVDTARQENPDLILMDVCMPRMGGLEATRKLRSDVKTARIPIIALTALNTAEDVRRAIQAGCSDYETKPVALIKLNLKIRKLLGA